MKQPGNSVTLTLIFSSVILLLVLQFFWLRKVYTDESESFYKETHGLFRSMIFEMNDSLLMRSIEPVPGDSSVHFFSNRETDTLHFRKRKQFNFTDSTANVQVFISSSDENDSVDRYIKPLVTKIRRDHSQKKFSIRLSSDSLKLSDVKKEFEDVLTTAGIRSAFLIEREKSELPFPPRRMIINDDVIFTPTGSYTVKFPEVKSLILAKIAPQIFFSAFLTLLTACSFFLLYRSLRMQQRLMELKNDFISNITHELKTPVTTVGVAIEALKSFKGLDNPKLTEEYLDIAQNELNRLSILTDKILKTAVFEDKGVEYTSEAIEFDKLVQQVLDSMRLLFDKQNARVHFEMQGSDFHLNGGSIHLTSVVYNLVDNALKYSPTSPEISVLIEDKTSKIVLTITDKGVGIAPEYRKKVFEKFFRVPTGDVHNIKGYGLGLSYVERVVKSHQGTIELDSEQGKGSRFKITLPK